MTDTSARHPGPTAFSKWIATAATNGNVILWNVERAGRSTAKGAAAVGGPRRTCPDPPRRRQSSPFRSTLAWCTACPGTPMTPHCSLARLRTAPSATGSAAPSTARRTRRPLALTATYLRPGPGREGPQQHSPRPQERGAGRRIPAVGPSLRRVRRWQRGGPGPCASSLSLPPGARRRDCTARCRLTGGRRSSTCVPPSGPGPC